MLQSETSIKYSREVRNFGWVGGAGVGQLARFAFPRPNAAAEPIHRFTRTDSKPTMTGTDETRRSPQPPQPALHLTQKRSQKPNIR